MITTVLVTETENLFTGKLITSKNIMMFPDVKSKKEYKSKLLKQLSRMHMNTNERLSRLYYTDYK